MKCKVYCTTVAEITVIIMCTTKIIHIVGIAVPYTDVMVPLKRIIRTEHITQWIPLGDKYKMKSERGCHANANFIV